MNFILYDGIGIIVSLSNQVLGKKGRYRPREYNKQFPDIVRALSSKELGIATKRTGSADDFGKRRRTELYPGPTLVELVVGSGVAAEDFVILPPHETIILKGPRGTRFDEPVAIDYADDDNTLRIREEMERINRCLMEADVSIVGEPLDESGRPIDPTDRAMRRVFSNGSFDEGGRLFGGFWQPMNKRQRHDHILIDGQPATTLDYGQMNAMILYGHAGATPPKGDAYFLPGLENWREGIKKVFNAMVYAPNQLSRFPKFTNRLFPEGVAVEEVTSAVEKRHPAIRHLFYRSLGLHAMYLESQVLVRLMLRLSEKSRTALPVHDAVIVRRDQVDLVKAEMKGSFRELMATPIEVREER